MVLLEFWLDRTALAEEREPDLRTANEAALYINYFLMPVRLRVANEELLETMAIHEPSSQENDFTRVRIALGSPMGPDTVWRELPLLHIATVGLARVQAAGQKTTSRYDLPEGGRLSFQMAPPQISVHSTLNGRTGTVP